MIRAVLDTNVVASACFWRGPSFRCLTAWAEGRFTALVSPQILTEYAETFDRLRRRYPGRPFVDWLADLQGGAELVFPAVRLPDVFTDPDDAALAECAVAGEAQYLVSGDKRHVQAVGSFRGVEIMPPAQFLELLEEE